MNAPQVHLMLSHVPVIGTLGVGLALLAGIAFRSAALVRFGLALMVAVGLATIPVFLSGEPSEKHIEHLAGVSEHTIEAHEEMAQKTTVGIAVVALLALVALVRSRGREPARGWSATILLLTVVLGVALAWTAHLGGRIRHPEIHSGAGAAGAPADRDET
jgi:uncharacterized membrane protein